MSKWVFGTGTLAALLGVFFLGYGAGSPGVPSPWLIGLVGSAVAIVLIAMGFIARRVDNDRRETVIKLDEMAEQVAEGIEAFQDNILEEIRQTRQPIPRQP